MFFHYNYYGFVKIRVDGHNMHMSTENDFNVFSDNMYIESNDDRDENEIENVEFVTIEENILPVHFRCGSHTLNLVATTDAFKALLNVSYKTRYNNAFNKLNSLCCKTNRPKSSEIITSILQSSLILPCKTRWNSLFDCVKRILQFSHKLLNKTMDELDLAQFTSNDIDFFKEYLQVMEPVAVGIDNLQSSESYYAIFLPTLHKIKYSLESLEKTNLIYCLPLLEQISAGFFKRFACYFDLDNEKCIAATMASVSHPYFKTRYIHEESLSNELINKIQELLIKEATKIEHSTKTTSTHDNFNQKTNQNNEKKNEFKYKFFESAVQQQICLIRKISNISEQCSDRKRTRFVPT